MYGMPPPFRRGENVPPYDGGIHLRHGIANLPLALGPTMARDLPARPDLLASSEPESPYTRDVLKVRRSTREAGFKPADEFTDN
jgi:hypothetical protein